MTSDEQTLSSRSWLNDSLVNASQQLIKRSFPYVNGLQETTLVNTLAFDIKRSEFDKVLHTGYGHWVTVYNLWM